MIVIDTKIIYKIRVKMKIQVIVITEQWWNKIVNCIKNMINTIVYRVKAKNIKIWNTIYTNNIKISQILIKSRVNNNKLYKVINKYYRLIQSRQNNNININIRQIIN